MKADSVTLLQVLSSNVHYALPHFQREYAWQKDEWQTLINDVFAVCDEYSPNQPPEHFLGSLVVVEDGIKNSVIPAFKLVDGQQRLTSVSLLLCALREQCRVSHPAVHANIQGMLFNSFGADESRFKLLPTAKYGDQTAYLALLEGKEVPECESGIPKAYAFFAKELEKRAHLDVAQLFHVLLNCLYVVFISLSQSENPYRIFESLNGKGKALSQADLVRNFLAMKLPVQLQQPVFENSWSPIEKALQEKRLVGRIGELTAFLRHYLAMRLGNLPNENHVYARFRDYTQQFDSSETFAREIENLRRFAFHYDTLLRPQHEKDDATREQLQNLRALDATSAYPFLLALFEMRDQNFITREQWLFALKTLENYLVRRFLGAEPTNYLNKMFPTLRRELDIARFEESLHDSLASKNYPGERRISNTLRSTPFYGNQVTQRKAVFVLSRLNRHLSTGSGGYTVLDGTATLEHIMPQTLSTQWHESLEENAAKTHSEYLHSLGNLTLVTQEWNASLSNAPFEEKKARLGEHALQLNKLYFGPSSDENWDETAILQRAAWLGAQAELIWPSFAPEQTLSTGQTSTWRRPIALQIEDQTFAVSSWRDVMEQVAKYLISCGKFESIALQATNTLRQNKFTQRCRELPNGWWVLTNVSANDAMLHCARLLQLAGIKSENWKIEEEIVVYQKN